MEQTKSSCLTWNGAEVRTDPWLVPQGAPRQRTNPWHGPGEALHGWAAFPRAVPEYSGCWSGLFPSPKKARYKRLQLYNFQINEIKCGQTQTVKEEGISAQENCTVHQAHFLSTRRVYLIYSSFSFILPILSFSLQWTNQMVVPLNGYSWGKPPNFRHMKPGKSWFIITLMSI